MYKTGLMIVLKSFCILLCFYCTALCADAVVARDPTEPFGFEENALGKKSESLSNTSLVLEAILISGKDRFAIINNKLVKVGDTIGASKVKVIDTYQVTLVGETGETVLALFGRPIKEPVK